jgi:molecular chaperone IbpA|tara:strand:+ start:4022 stop:4546 length:525 start_codon:yes stop_codon:yes gene_type:complete
MTFLKAFPFEDSPFFQHTVGFDRIFDQLETVQHGLERTDRSKYPPYNIVKTSDDTFTIELAVAGFSKENLDVEIKENTLSVKGTKNEEDGKRAYVHQGLASRSFERHFTLADHVEVVDGDIVNGVLVINLERVVPDVLKPKKIKLGSADPSSSKSTLLQEKLVGDYPTNEPHLM